MGATPIVQGMETALQTDDLYEACNGFSVGEPTQQRTGVAGGFLEQVVWLRQQATKIQQLGERLTQLGLSSLARRKLEKRLEGMYEQVTDCLCAFSPVRRVRDGIVREMQRLQARLEGHCRHRAEPHLLTISKNPTGGE